MKPKTKIKKLIKELVNLGPVLPGSISKVYNVCGKATCRCKDKDNPQKHGPYNLLSYTIAGKSSTKFIKDGDLKEVQQMQAKFQRLKQICQELPVAYIELFKDQGLDETVDFGRSLSSEFENSGRSDKRLLHRISELEKQVGQWSGKATERTRLINTQKARIAQLEKSRDYWKTQAESGNDSQVGSDKKKLGGSKA